MGLGFGNCCCVCCSLDLRCGLLLPIDSCFTVSWGGYFSCGLVALRVGFWFDALRDGFVF